MRRHMLFLSALAFSAAGCGEAPNEGASQHQLGVLRTDSTMTLLLSTHSGFRQPEQRAVTSLEDWNSVWATAHAGMQPVPPVPEVDFAQEAVLLAASGTRSNGGYAISIDSVETSGTGQRVYVTRTSPAETCMTTAVMTNPVHLVRVRLPLGSLSWQESAKTQAC